MSPKKLMLSGLSGLVGACALTLIHETARRTIPNAPRMDVLGMRALAKTLRKADVEPPKGEDLFNLTMVGDIVSNAAYYSAVGLGKPEGALVRGTLLGLAAGVGAVFLPGPLGLGSAPSSRTNATKAITVGWYTAGGIVAAIAYRLLTRKTDIS